jgi:hypothetical protein
MKFAIGVAVGIALVYLGVTDRVLIAGKGIARKFS